MADSGVIYGPTGSFKTTAVAHFSHYIAETTGKATLLFSSDGGGWKAAQEEIDAGMILPYRCDSDKIPFSVIRKVSQGFWPLNPEESDISRVNFVPMDFSKVGGIAVEGLTSASDMLMRFSADKGLLVSGEKVPVSKFTQPIVVNGEIVQESFSSNSQGHYGNTQKAIYSMVMNFISLPVRYVLFTAHEAKTEDDDRTTIYGPAISGKKATPMVGAWVGDLIHAQDEAVRSIVKGPDPKDPTKQIDVEVLDTVCRYYYKKHPDPVTGIMFPAKPRVTHSQVEALNKRYPGGYFVPTPGEGFDKYLRTVDELGKQAGESNDALRRWREKQDEKLGRARQPQPSIETNVVLTGGRK